MQFLFTNRRGWHSKWWWRGRSRRRWRNPGVSRFDRLRISHVGWHGNPVPFGVHALDEGVIVLALTTVAGSTCTIGPHCATDQQAGAGTDSGTLATANRRAGNCSDCRTNHRTANRRLICRLLAAPATNLPQSKISASKIVSAEALHRLPCAG